MERELAFPSSYRDVNFIVTIVLIKKPEMCIRDSDNTHYKLLDNCMLYTMLTRAKKRCLLCAEPQAFYKCLNTSNNARNTWLSTIKRKGK